MRSVSFSADFRMKLPPVDVVLVGTDTIADRGDSGMDVSERWGLLHGHPWGHRSGHQWGLFMATDREQFSLEAGCQGGPRRSRDFAHLE